MPFMYTQPQQAEMKADLRVFLFAMWRELNLPAPTDAQYDIASYLQHGPERCIIQAFRGVGKSWLTSGFVVWALWNNPQLKIMVVSASKERADAFSSFVKRIIQEMPFLHHLKPTKEQRDSVIAFDVGPARPDHSPSVKSVGVTGQLTGSRADLIIADDVEVTGNSATQGMRDKLSELVKEFDAILKPLPTSRIIYLGTPQCEMSLYNALLDRGYLTRIWPCEVPEDMGVYKGLLAPYLVDLINKKGMLPGDPLDPKRFSREDLAKRRLSYGRAGYQLQFMLNTSLADGDRYPLKLSDMIVMGLDLMRGPTKLSYARDASTEIKGLEAVGLTGDRYYGPMWVEKDMREWQGTVMAIDPSGRGGDETAFAIVSMLHGNLFVRRVGGFKGGYSDDTLQCLSVEAKRYGVNTIIIESNFGDGMYAALLKPVLNKIYPCTVEEVRSSSQKELRIIETLEPVMSSHRLVVDRAVVERDLQDSQEALYYSLFYQLTRITKDKGALRHDDRLDALAMAVAHWLESLAQDQDKLARKHTDKLMDAEIKKFLKANKKLPKGGRMGNKSLR